MARQDERERGVEGVQFLLEQRVVWISQPVEGGDGSVLVKVGHGGGTFRGAGEMIKVRRRMALGAGPVRLGW